MLRSTIINLIKQKFGNEGKHSKIPLLKSDIYFDAEYNEEGILVSNLGNEPFIPWDVFVETISLLEKKDGRALKGDAMNSKLGDPGLPLDSIEGYISNTVYGKKIGESVFRRVTPVACILIWAGLCYSHPGELRLVADMNPNHIDIKAHQKKLQQFAEERNWEQFHSPKNLVMALAGEAAELLEIFQWLSEEQSKEIVNSNKDMQLVEDEIADVFNYLVRIADKLNVDIKSAVNRKIIKNANNYPVELSKGNAVKYNRR
jgi:dCTP diphosphatase